MNNSISIDFSKLLENPEGYNVKIIVGKEPNVKEFKAHSLILTNKSDYFKSAFSSRWARVENGITIFNKPNISPSVFEVLLKYFYTGVISIENNEISLVDIAIASDELQLLEVYKQVEERLLENKLVWKPREIITIFHLFQHTNLYNIAIGLVCRNPKLIFESEDFFKLKEIHLINLLKCDDLQLKEIEIWKYLIQWGIENTDSIEDYDLTKWTQENFTDLKYNLRNCIPHIRFFQMSPDDYTRIVAHFMVILPDGLNDEMIQYFSDPNSNPSFKILPLRGYPFESKIINVKDAGLIASWIDNRRIPYHFTNLPFKFMLIYRASRDGFEIENFYKNCDNKGPTIVVIKVRDSGEIIGGYNPLEWCRIKIENDERSSLLSYSNDFDHRYKTSNSFIFSLTNREFPILSRASSKNDAIIWCRNKGPCFGLQDLCITSLRPNNIICKSVKHSYEKKVISRETFEIEEYEVFQIVDERFSQYINRWLKRIFQFIMLMLKGIFQFIKWILWTLMLLLMNFFKLILLIIRITIFLCLGLFYFCSLGLFITFPFYLSHLTFIWYIYYKNYCSDFSCNLGVIFGVVFLPFAGLILISILTWPIVRYIFIKITWCFLFITTGVLFPAYFNTFL